MENKLLQTLEEFVTGQEIAIGNDLVYVPDFEKACTDMFKKRVYTSAEMAYCDQFADALLRYASTWAAKEAVYKAVKQLDQSTLGWDQIEVVREKIGGKPAVNLRKEPGRFRISLSISHDGDYAWAVAFAQIKL
ncbi:MAG: holo-ACP synthase [Bacteroidetes bacterium]|nr:holo-ACP synthase [Bacteroidota bacterium]